MNMESTLSTRKRKSPTWTFQPDDDVRLLMAETVGLVAGLKGPGDARGLRTKLINEALRLRLAGKGQGA